MRAPTGLSERVNRAATLCFKPIMLKRSRVHARARARVNARITNRNFAVPGEAEASGYALTLPEDAVRGSHH